MRLTTAISIINRIIYDNAAMICLVFAVNAGIRIAAIFRNSTQIEMYCCRHFLDGHAVRRQP